MCFSADSKKIALRGHNEMEDSLNPDGFRPLLKFIIKLDNGVETHFETSKAFLSVSHKTKWNCAMKWI